MKKLMLLLHMVLLYTYAISQTTFYSLNNGAWSDPNNWAMTSNGLGPAGPPTANDDIVIRDTVHHFPGSNYRHNGNITIEGNAMYAIFHNNGASGSYTFAGGVMDIMGELYAKGDFNHQEDGSGGSGILILHPGARLHLGDDLIINAFGSVVIDNPDCGAAFSCDDIYFLGTGATICGEGSALVPGQVRMWDDNGNEIGPYSAALAAVKQQICQNFPLYASMDDCETDTPFLIGSGTPTFPVEFLSLDSNPTPFGVEINWSTASELNNDYFSLERSQDGEKFELVTRVPGSGTSYKVKEYSFIDERAYKGTSYYRVKQTDLDGTSSYSDLLEVSYEPDNSKLVAFPNPVPSYQNGITLKMEGLEPNYPVKVSLIDMKGCEAVVKFFDSDYAGRMEERISTNVPAGNYIVNVQSGQIIKTQRIIIH